MAEFSQDRRPTIGSGPVARPVTFLGRGNDGDLHNWPSEQVSMSDVLTRDTLIANLMDARARTLELVHGLDDEQLMGPRLDIVNPLLWEIGHLAWFHEFFVLRRLDGREPILASPDNLYDSMKVHHDTRWDLELPDLHGTFQYMRAVEEEMIQRLADEQVAGGDDAYLYQLTTFHEDMHDEAFTYTRQTLGYPKPDFRTATNQPKQDAGPYQGDVDVPGATIELGSKPGGRFIFDNEKFSHEVGVGSFRIAKAPVTNAEYRDFVEDGGYKDDRFWDDAGRHWRDSERSQHPVYWRRGQDGNWWVKHFDDEVPLPLHHPVSHVNWYEANAWCHWAGRRLPSEAEWEAASAYDASWMTKRRYPWGDEMSEGPPANLDGRYIGTVDVGAFPEGDSAFGCRQMLGNVWEWTSSDFLPFPGFSVDPYEDYSKPWFGTRKVLRGGAWATRSRMITNTYRNFFTPERRDTINGFRTCAI